MTRRRLIIAAAATAAAAVALYLFWPYLAAAGLALAAFRHLTRGTRRRRPKSSYAALLKSAALLYAAWNSRWLKPTTHRASAPAKAGAEHDPDRHNDDEGGAFGVLPEGF